MSSYMPQSLLYLTHDDWIWAQKYLSNNYISDKTATSIKVRNENTMAHGIDALIIATSITCIFYRIVSLSFFHEHSHSVREEIFKFSE